MRVKQLIETLKKMPKNSYVRIRMGEKEKEVNYWVRRITSYNKGESGYEEHGEVIIVGDE